MTENKEGIIYVDKVESSREDENCDNYVYYSFFKGQKYGIKAVIKKNSTTQMEKVIHEEALIAITDRLNILKVAGDVEFDKVDTKKVDWLVKYPVKYLWDKK
mgnify:CR=1 FL=1